MSKFGTLVIPATPEIRLEPDRTKAVQIGRSVISFTVKKIEVEGPKQPKPVLMPKYAPSEDEEDSVDLVEEELKKKIEITNQKI